MNAASTLSLMTHEVVFPSVAFPALSANMPFRGHSVVGGNVPMLRCDVSLNVLDIRVSFVADRALFWLGFLADLSSGLNHIIFVSL